MYFKDYLGKYNNKHIDIYIDMDGVIADYDVINYEKNKEEANVYLYKRPVNTVIKILEEISHLENVSLFILSVSRKDNQIDGKVKWLDKNMSYIKKEHINIIPREGNGFKAAHDLKKEFLKSNINKENINIMIDDSHKVLDAIYELDLDIIPLHITSILD